MTSTHDHPHPTPDAGALVMFGLTGDLGEKKLLPALAELAVADLLPGPVIGVGRSEHSDAELRSLLVDAAGPLAPEVDERLDLHYLQGDSTDPDTYSRLDERITDTVGEGAEIVVYAALPPDLFGGVAKGIAEAGMSERVRLVVEKPFGHDAASARELHAAITEHLPADRLFAVDHFLAKSAVENLHTFRSANPMIEAAMHAGVVERVELTMAEAFGVDGRGSFYDPVGAIRDVVQNHLLQTIAVLLMDPPADDSAEAFAASRARLLDAVRPLDPDAVVLGQYDGYRDIDGVDDDSRTETFVAAVLEIDDERWGSVPVAIRTGKELSASYTEAVVRFRGDANQLRFQLKPETTIAVEVGVLDAETHGVRPTTMWACGPSDHGALGDYATMLAGALAGDHRHFAKIDDIVAAWDIVAPILDRDLEPLPYAPGTDGPGAADDLLPGGFTDGPRQHPSAC